MQLNQLSLAGGLTLVSALLVACGGGGGGDDAPAAAPAVAAVTASAASRSSTPLALEDTLLTFNGGTCGGGTAPYTTTWSFGDGTTGSTNTHTYADPGTYSVTVTCTDTNNVSKTSSALNLEVKSKAWKGFLGRTWSAYANIDPAHGFLYPVAGITTLGDIYGVWLRSNADEFGTYMTTTDVAAGSTNFSAATWTMATPDLQTGTQSAPSNMSPFVGTSNSPTTAAMDMAVSPSGKALAAWMTVTTTGTQLWYATKDGSSDWSTPKPVNVPVLDASIKVVVNDAGDGAIAYCTGTTPKASMVIYSKTNNDITGTPGVISEQCDNSISYVNTQRSRAFDIAIRTTSGNTSEVIAVGLTPSGANSVVKATTYNLAGATTSTFDVATIPTAELPTGFSLSYALSPDGKVAGVAWTENGTPPAPYASTPKLTNVNARIYAEETWGAAVSTQPLTIHNFSRPLIAVNDDGQAFLALERPTVPPASPTAAINSYRTYVSNYAPATGWRTSVVTDDNLTISADYRISATDVAIDQWGTGLITRLSTTLALSQAGTFSIEGAWSGFKNISPGYTNFHYQTMRALPDGQAILTTSVKSAGGGLRSGYVLLK